MGQFFLIKEQIRFDSNKKETYLVGELDCDSKDDALKQVKDYLTAPSDIVYLVEVVAKCYGDLKPK